MTGRVHQHPPTVWARLNRCSGRPQGDSSPLANIEIGDGQLKVKLLANLSSGPLRHAVIRDTLHSDQHRRAA